MDTSKFTTTRRRLWPWAAIAGVVSAGAFLAVAELVALLIARDGSPILGVGSFVIDIVPQWAKEFAIQTFGSNDKLFLLIGLGVGIGIAAAAAGVLEFVRPLIGVAVLVVAGVASVASAVTRAAATPFASLPTIIGTVAGSVLLYLLAQRLRSWRDSVAEPDMQRAALDRRGFIRFAATAGAIALVVGVGARVVNVTSSSIAGIRKALKLPAPRSTVTIPAGADLRIPGISPLFTANKDFYRVDTALSVPSIDPETWRLTIDGLVDKQVSLSFDDLVGMGLDEYVITLTCVSNEVGGNLVGNAKWLGVPIRNILSLASPRSGADMVLSRSADGFTASTPLSSLTDPGLNAILAVGMNGEPLPLEHGFPVRMVVPGLYGYVSATKWLTELKVTTFAADTAYWTPRGYSATAPIKLSSRVDTPRINKAIDPGSTRIAGVAWAQTVGIAGVEVNIDDGDWQQATLSTPVNQDSWVQWYLDWNASSGTHYVAVRATDKNGKLQEQEPSPIAPNGSTGWQKTLIRVN
ncbi:oxidoreductase [Cryobacterium sp. Sr8]|uniref:molybdopterin-dependent oxidoreductase n=1 Tax=unclassified Cryobacterium TaxID=2649013 RepID=UPI00106AEE75|nr:MULTISPECIES: molybdopterin-dependent oxidoreductase [unclassified Cryobacterium]TFD44694.1 oxidoreductase [Cryobacterium sp. TMT1-2-1]TFD74595.1 oxidoreductase [Cryobacterium sp. Sr8]